MKWFKHGKKHRDGDLPAVIDNKKQIWYKNAFMHRDNELPAYVDGKTMKWCVNGQLHRDNDLPAVIEHKVLTYINPPESTLCVSWFNKGKLHRNDDKPAIIRGKEEYVMMFLDKKLRTDVLEKKNAFLWSNIHQEWYVDGVRHREGDNPSIITGPCYAVWYKNGEKYRYGNKPFRISGNSAWWIVDGKEVRSDVFPPPYDEWF
jgi:hypothetical protein